MVYPIVKYGDTVLEKVAEAITEFDTPELHKLVDDMFESMYAARGVGLAAPQIGVSLRIAVIDCSAGEDPDQKVYPGRGNTEWRGGLSQCARLSGERKAGQACDRARAECQRRHL
jgi:hypothetical protein